VNSKIPWIHDSRCARLWHCELPSTHDVQEHSGFETPGDSGTLTNFVEISQSRDKILRVPQTRSSTDTCHCRSSCSGLTVLQVSGTVSTSGSATSIGPKGYLTSLDSQVIKTEAEIGDIRCARMLFDSLIQVQSETRPRLDRSICLGRACGAYGSCA
jgi:pre-mRNA-processing factor 6